MRAAELRVELQAEVDGQREGLFPLVSTADGLATWMDAATLDRVLDPRSMTKGGDGGRGE